MIINIEWNNVTDTGGKRTTVIKTIKDKTTAELIIGWLTANNRKPSDVIIHSISTRGVKTSLEKADNPYIENLIKERKA